MPNSGDYTKVIHAKCCIRKKEKCCSNAYASVDGTVCEAFSGWAGCPAGYAEIYNPKTCPIINGEIKYG